jgi:hypothetical protein
MILKAENRFSDKIMLKTKNLERDSIVDRGLMHGANARIRSGAKARFFQLSGRLTRMGDESAARLSISFANDVGARPTTAMALDIGLRRIGFGRRLKRACDKGVEPGDTFG